MLTVRYIPAGCQILSRNLLTHLGREVDELEILRPDNNKMLAGIANCLAVASWPALIPLSFRRVPWE